MKWYTYTGQKRVDGAIGLEIETESKAPYVYIKDLTDLWNVHNDGSLRQNGVEYVFSTPYDYKSVNYAKALAVFDEQAKVAKFIPSVYTSVHVHLNVTNSEVVEVFNFMALYFIVEELLNEYCGPDRNGNLFCLKTSSAECVYRVARDMVAAFDKGPEFAKHYISRLSQNALKYAAMNLYTLRQFGSLEIRTHPGTVNIDEIHRWISILVGLFKFAKTFSNPVQLVQAYHKNSSEFLSSCFGEYASYFNLMGTKEKLSDGLWYATILADASPDWKNFGKNFKADEFPKFAPQTTGTLSNEQIQDLINAYNAHLITTAEDV